MDNRPLLAAHLKLCQDTNAAVEACFAKEGVTNENVTKFPEACVDLAVVHMECAVHKRDKAITIAKKLLGEEATAKAFPYYEEQKQKALGLIQIYKDHAAGGKSSQDGPFWNPVS